MSTFCDGQMVNNTNLSDWFPKRHFSLQVGQVAEVSIILEQGWYMLAVDPARQYC